MFQDWFLLAWELDWNPDTLWTDWDSNPPFENRIFLMLNSYTVTSQNNRVLLCLKAMMILILDSLLESFSLLLRS
jgi:hypothetical protein